MNKKIRAIFLIAFFLLSSSGINLFSSPGGLRITINGFLDWEKGEIKATTDLNVLSAGIIFPSGRNHAEEILSNEYLSLIKPLLFSIQVDSSTTVGDLIHKGELTHNQLNEICLAAKVLPPNFSADLINFSGNYTVQLGRLSASLIRHRQAYENERPLVPTPAANYTGIIIMADSLLPIHGRNTSSLIYPCIFPKIWDTEMNLIYEKNNTDPSLTGVTGVPVIHYAKNESILRSTPSGLSPELTALVGERPLRIFARSVFGIVPTDPVIDRSDALLILSNENNRSLLKESRIVMIINESVMGRNL